MLWKVGQADLQGTAGLQLQLTVASTLIQGLGCRQSRGAQTLPTASFGTKMKLSWPITARTDRTGDSRVFKDTLASLPETWSCTPLDQSSLIELYGHLVNMGNSQPHS